MAWNDLLLPAGAILFIGVIGVYLVYIFNKLMTYRNAADANLGQIRVSLKKRLDMIEQLLGAVKGYVSHERELFKEITSMRAKVMETRTGDLTDIDRDSRSITGGLLAIAEAYPELKANETVNQLMTAIISVEDEIARHRYTYNNIVQSLNTMTDTIPSNMVAGAAGVEKLDYLQFEEEVEARPDLAGISES
jgi:LemA protein